jgi:hypothetical protein
MAKLTPEQVEQIEAWGAKGKSGLWVSNKLSLPAATVNYRMLRAGYDPWPGHTGRRSGQRGAFSDEEDARMVELAKTMAPHKVAIEMRRAKTSILIRLMTLEVRAEKALEKAA